MVDFATDRIHLPRDRRVQITGRLCSLCKANAPIALVVNVSGLQAFNVTLCVECIIRASYRLAAREDVIVAVNTELQHGASTWSGLLSEP